MIGRKLSALRVGIWVTAIVAFTFFIGGFTGSAVAQVKTLKVGHLFGLQNPLGLNSLKLLEAVTVLINEKGGLVIGGEKYRIELISHDTKSSPEIGRAGAEKMVYQDKVKFILGDPTADAWISVTEENKAVVTLFTPSPAVLKPDLKYTFQASFLNTAALINWSWFSNRNPKVKRIGCLFNDNLPGHADAKQIEMISRILGLQMVGTVFYPEGTTDFSAMATRIKSANPDVFTTAGGGPLEQVLSLKAMRQAGWQGPYFGYRPLVPGLWSKIAPIDMLEGSFFAMSDIDTSIFSGAPLSRVSQEIRDAYIAKYGNWDYPLVDMTVTWYLLRAAVESAQSIDPDKLAAVIGNGLKYDTPFGPAMMISRPDMNNPKTIDAVFGTNMATVEKGKIKLIHTISVKEAFDYVKKSGAFGVYPQ